MGGRYCDRGLAPALYRCRPPAFLNSSRIAEATSTCLFAIIRPAAAHTGRAASLRPPHRLEALLRYVGANPDGSRQRDHKCPHRRHAEGRLLPIHAGHVTKAAHKPPSRFCAQPRPRKGHRVPKQENQKMQNGVGACRRPAPSNSPDHPPRFGQKWLLSRGG
jgi:hypothetical protein